MTVIGKTNFTKECIQEGGTCGRWFGESSGLRYEDRWLEVRKQLAVRTFVNYYPRDPHVRGVMESSKTDGVQRQLRPVTKSS